MAVKYYWPCLSIGHANQRPNTHNSRVGLRIKSIPIFKGKKGKNNFLDYLNSIPQTRKEAKLFKLLHLTATRGVK